MTDLDRLLIAAAARGDVPSVSRLLREGANVTAQDERGHTALIEAAYEDHLEVAQLLVEAGADVNAQDQTQQSAFLIATSEGYLGLLRLTLAARADVRSTDSYYGTGLIRAAERGHVEIVGELLNTNVPVDHVNRLGWTALLEAIILGDGGTRHTEVVRLLLRAGADPNLSDGASVSPLAHAKRHGYSAIAQLLRETGGK